MNSITEVKKSRDYNVELLRIAAALIVIGTHIKFTDFTTKFGEVDKTKVLWDSFFGEGVTIFFLILGFFYFKNSCFDKLVKKLYGLLYYPH